MPVNISFAQHDGTGAYTTPATILRHDVPTWNPYRYPQNPFDDYTDYEDYVDAMETLHLDHFEIPDQAEVRRNVNWF